MLRFNTFYPPESDYSISDKWFKKDVEQRSGGRLQLEMYYSSSLGFGLNELFSGVSQGLCDISKFGGANAAGELPFVGLSSAPALFPDYESTFSFVESTYYPALKDEALKKWNVNMIALSKAVAPIWLFSKKPFRNLNDLKGAAIRVYGGPVVDLFTLLEMKPVFLSTQEVYTGLQQGLADSAITSLMTANDSHFYEVLDYWNRMLMFISSQSYGMNQDVFNKLPPDLQQILLDAAKDYSNYEQDYLKVGQDRLAAVLIKNGMEPTDPDPGVMAQIKVIAKPVYEKIAKDAGPTAEKILRDLGAID